MTAYYIVSLMLFICGGIGISIKRDLVGVLQFFLIMFYAVILFVLFIMVDNGANEDIGFVALVILMTNVIVVVGLALISNFMKNRTNQHGSIVSEFEI